MKDFWKRFSQNRGAVVGLVILLLVVIVSIVAPFLYTKSPWAMVQRPFIPPFTMDAFFSVRIRWGVISLQVSLTVPGCRFSLVLSRPWSLC